MNPAIACALWACRAEALARKPGNVHPQASFADLTIHDFLSAAQASAPALALAGQRGVGRAVYDAVSAARERAVTNVNLGICLLIAPCAAAAIDRPFHAAVADVLQALTIEDAFWAYRAIRAAQPGGLGSAPQQDVAQEPSVSLLEAMRLAAGRDRIAAQYATGFLDVEHLGVAALARWSGGDLEVAIVAAHLELMAAFPDTLIARKCGPAVAAEAQDRAQGVLAAGWPDRAAASQFAELDAWLRQDGHRRNPGTSADLVAASLFVALRWEIIELPGVREWCQDRMSSIPD